jgi:hypothetical protein
MQEDDDGLSGFNYLGQLDDETLKRFQDEYDKLDGILKVDDNI